VALRAPKKVRNDLELPTNGHSETLVLLRPLEPKTRLESFRAWLRRHWVPVVLVAAALAMCGAVTVQHSQSFSPLDEWVYYDYVLKIPTQGVVHQGEFLGEPALEAMSCFGDGFGPRGEPCTGPNGDYDNPAAYPQQGKTSADLYTPLYFAFTWATGKAVQLLTGFDFLTAARLTGFFWLAGGLVAFYALARQLRLSKIVTLGLGLTVIGLPASRYAFTYITTDAPSFFFGSLLLLLAVRFVRGTLRHPWWLIFVAALAVLVKITNLFALGLMVVFLLVYAITAWRKGGPPRYRAVPPRRIITVATLSVVVAVLAEIAWLAIRAAIRVGDGPDQGVGSPFSIRGVAASVATFIGVPYPNTVDNVLSLPYAVMYIAGIFGFFLSARGFGMKRALSLSTVVSVTLFPPLLLIAMSVALGSAFPVAARYGVSLLPAAFVGVAMITRNQVSRYLLLVYGAVLVIAAIARSFYLS
jgi:hypothetical protein